MLITSLAEPESWENNGGSLSRIHMLGERMFVEAPPRIHERVSWILGQVAGGEIGAAEARRYPLRHAGAEEVLQSLRTSPALQPVDFTKVVWDPHTNSIVVHATAAQHQMVKDAIAALDKEVTGPER